MKLKIAALVGITALMLVFAPPASASVVQCVAGSYLVSNQSELASASGGYTVATVKTSISSGSGIDYNFAVFRWNGTVAWSTGAQTTSASFKTLHPNVYIAYGGYVDVYGGKNGDGAPMCGHRFQY